MKRATWIIALWPVLVLGGQSIQNVMAAPEGLLTSETSLLQQALAGPLKGVEEVVFANRLSYDDGHWYANIGYYCDDETQIAYAGNGRPDVGRLSKINLTTGKVTVLIDAVGGSIRDPVVHYQAEKILFSYRLRGSHYYNLYEIGVDGSNLRQITRGEFDDYEPTYLPDGEIVFVSTRCKRWVNCWKTQVGTLYRCDSEGGNIRPISSNIEHDNTPSVLPDGRLLYTRWEYVDRSQVGYHHLWTMNPDGTTQKVYFGNQRHWELFIDTKPIPGTDLVLGINSPGHGRKNHLGHVAIFSSGFGPDDERGVVTLTSGNPRFNDPYPLSEEYFLVASGRTILLMNRKGESEVIHRSDQDCHEPWPIKRRVKERVIPSRLNLEKKKGQLILTDVYTGRSLKGIDRGEIDKLLVLETLPKPVNFSGGQDMLSWQGTFTLERILGTVPVEPDGSAWFEIPADRPIFVVTLDRKGHSVKRMQSFVSVRPGEVTSCLGCHEERTAVPETRRVGLPMALGRGPSQIQPFEGFPDVMDFSRDIQPILDRRCTSCHDFDQHAGNLSLEGDLGPRWSHSYYALFAHLQVADGRNGFGNQPPRSIGSSASRLMKKIDGSHHGVEVTEIERQMIWLWIESAAPFAGTYAALRNKPEQDLASWATLVFADGKRTISRRCSSCHDGSKVPTLPFVSPEYPDDRGTNRPVARWERVVVENDPLARFSSHILLNLTDPKQSPLLLGPLSRQAGGWSSCGDIFDTEEDSDYQFLLALIEKGKEKLDSIPRYTTPEWKPNRQYIREMKKYGVLADSFDESKTKVDPFKLDQEYFRSLRN